MSPKNQNSPFDGTATNYPIDRAGVRQEASNSSAILIRKLPKTLGLDALRSMLVFAKDLINAEFVTAGSEDVGFKAAIAHFQSAGAAQEARTMLDGKRNTTGDANMIVNVLPLSPGGSILSRRNTFEPRSPETLSGTRQSSKFNGTFQALDHMSPTRSPNFHQGESSQADSYGAMLSQQSSIGSPLERQPRSGKSIIGEDGVDDETGNILKDPVAYAKSEKESVGMQSQSRRPTLPQIPTARFSHMSINSSSNSPAMTGMTSPRGPPMQSPTAFSPPGMNNMNSTNGYPMSPHFMRNTMPPVNPADQNPPCNTLYVGNLPIDTSEDELKMIFSKQRGYKRLCFRTKANGPMCFVEFEDISFATKALQGLYGHMLSNSVKGGIRLSFSKNPLGVRSGQHNGMTSPMSPHGPMSGMNGYGGMQSFAAANGPPPGLAMPPGLNNSMAHMQNGLISYNGSSNTSPNGALGNSSSTPMSPIGTQGISVRSPIAGSGSSAWNIPNGVHQDYLYGR